jgi:hypothetical protein
MRIADCNEEAASSYGLNAAQCRGRRITNFSPATSPVSLCRLEWL